MAQYIEDEITVTVDVENEEVTLQNISISATVDSTEATYWETGSYETEVKVLSTRKDITEMIRQELMAQNLRVPENLQKLSNNCLQEIKEKAQDYVEANY